MKDNSRYNAFMYYKKIECSDIHRYAVLITHMKTNKSHRCSTIYASTTRDNYPFISNTSGKFRLSSTSNLVVCTSPYNTNGSFPLSLDIFWHNVPEIKHQFALSEIKNRWCVNIAWALAQTQWIIIECILLDAEKVMVMLRKQEGRNP